MTAAIGSQGASLIERENNERIAALVLEGTMESFGGRIAALNRPPVRQYVPLPHSAIENVPALR